MLAPESIVAEPFAPISKEVLVLVFVAPISKEVLVIVLGDVAGTLAYSRGAIEFDDDDENEVRAMGPLAALGGR